MFLTTGSAGKIPPDGRVLGRASVHQPCAAGSHHRQVQRGQGRPVPDAKAGRQVYARNVRHFLKYKKSFKYVSI